MNLPTVVCVLRSGGEYKPEHVQALRVGVGKHWPKAAPLRFVCLTDLPLPRMTGVETRPLRSRWPGWWSKMEMFSAQNDDLGDILYFDLDTIIVGSLDDIVKSQVATLLTDFYYPEKIATGMMYLPLGSRPDVYAGWVEMSEEFLKKLPGDGDYLDLLWRKRVMRWQLKLPGQVISYKVHVRQRRGLTIPDNARVLCFHGRPRPWQTPLWERER